jgi:uncharacterized protein DUF6458
MRIGASLTLLAIGAILAFAVTDKLSGIDLTVVGWILMAVGALGLILTMVFWGGASGRRRERIVEQDVTPQRTIDRDVEPM